MRSWLPIIAMSFLLLLSGCKSNDFVIMKKNKLDKAEMNGLKQYRKGNYEQAFNLLKEPAQWGYKGSQYVLAFMFLKGQYVKQSPVIGMGWLGVAKEAKVTEWSNQFNTFYNAATVDVQNRINKKVAQYIQQFGLKAQNVTCQKSLNTSTKRVDVKCHHYAGMGTLYDIELSE